jgi:hypothetical protein
MADAAANRKRERGSPGDEAASQAREAKEAKQAAAGKPRVDLYNGQLHYEERLFAQCKTRPTAC